MTITILSQCEKVLRMAGEILRGMRRLWKLEIADIYISISTGTFDIENIKYEKKWQQLDLDTNFEP